VAGINSKRKEGDGYEKAEHAVEQVGAGVAGRRAGLHGVAGAGFVDAEGKSNGNAAEPGVSAVLASAPVRERDYGQGEPQK
jgi:hypothetical protein